MYPIGHHLGFVIISTQHQLLLLLSDHLPMPHPEASVGCHILAASLQIFFLYKEVICQARGQTRSQSGRTKNTKQYEEMKL